MCGGDSKDEIANEDAMHATSKPLRFSICCERGKGPWQL